MSAEPTAASGDPAGSQPAPRPGRWLAVLLDVTADGRVFLHLDRPGARGQSHVFRSGGELGAFVATLLAAATEPGDAAVAALRDAARIIGHQPPDATTGSA